jgi:hypothetical protein
MLQQFLWEPSQQVTLELVFLFQTLVILTQQYLTLQFLRETKETKASKVFRVSKANRVFRVFRVFRVYKEKLERLDHKATLVLQALRDLRVMVSRFLGHTAH